MYQINYRYYRRYYRALPLLWAVLILIGISGCASTPQATTTTPQAAKTSPQGPDWINNRDSVYPPDQYMAAVGTGRDRSSAEKDALGALVAIFGQTVQGEITATYKYSEAVSQGLLGKESRSLDNTVKTSFSQDSIYGAEIKDVWFDNRNTYYAVAVMEKLRCTTLYGELISGNDRTIEELTAISERDRNSFEALSRYELAALIADANDAFINILAIMNPPSAALYRDELRRGDTYRLAFQDIARNIPITIVVDQDPGGRIGQAFAQAISGLGFRTSVGRGTPGDRYFLDVSCSLEPVELANNRNKFVRYVINAKLSDRQNGQVLFPFSINGREGHTTETEAQNRAIRAAEGKIGESFPQAFQAFLSQGAPKGKK